MPNGTSYGDSSAADLGPFHGNHEGQAIVQVWLAAAQALMLFIFPWLVALLDVLHPRSGHHLLAVSIWELCLMNSIGLITAWGYRILWRRLSTKIAEGGEDAPFLDQVRFQMASLVQGMVVLFVMSMVFISTSGR